MKNPLLRLLTTLVFLVFLTHCASTSKASVEKDQEAKAFTAPEGKGVVYLFRAGKFYGSALQFQVKVNGWDAGGSGPGTFFRWELKPGRHTLWSSTGESSAVAEVNVEAGKLYFFEQAVHMGLIEGRIKIDQVNGAVGKKAVLNSKLLVSAYLPE